MTQQSMDSLLAMAGQYSPTLGSIMQMLAPMIRAQTGVDIRTLANPLMPSSNMRRFNAMDALMMNDYTTPFRHGIYGPSRGNAAGDILNQGYYQLLQESRQAEAALGRSLQAAGAGYSFATSTGLNRQTIAQAMGRGRAPADVFASFSTFSQMDGPMNIGERGLMLEQMVGSGMMNGFSALTDSSTSKSHLGRALDRESVSRLKNDVSGMESALAEWKTVLGTTIPKVMESLSEIFGGNVTAAFMKNAQSLKSSALNIQHVASIAGVGIGEVIGNASAIGKRAVAYGASPGMSMQLGVFSTAYGAGVAGNAFSTAGDIKGSLAELAANAAASSNAKLMAGGFAAWRIKKSDLSDEEALSAYNKLMDGVDRIDTASLNNSLGLNLTTNELLRMSKEQPGVTYLRSNAAELGMRAIRDVRSDYLNAFKRADPVFQRLSDIEGVKDEDLLDVLDMTDVTEASGKIKALSNGTISAEAIQAFLGRREATHSAVKNDRLSGASVLGDVDLATTTSTLKQIAAGEAHMREAQRRTEISSTLDDSKTGSRLANAVSLLYRDQTTSVRDLAKLVFGIEDPELVAGLDAANQDGLKRKLDELKTFETEINTARTKAREQNPKDAKANVDFSRAMGTLISDWQRAKKLGNVKGMDLASSQLANYGVTVADDGSMSFGAVNQTGIENSIDKTLETKTPDKVIEEIQTSLKQLGLDEVAVGENNPDKVLVDADSIKAHAILSNTPTDRQREVVEKLNQFTGEQSIERRQYMDSLIMGSPDMARQVTESLTQSGLSPDSVTVSSFLAQLKVMLEQIFNPSNH